MHAKPDELDVSSLMDTEEASKKFKRAEKSAFHSILSVMLHLHYMFRAPPTADTIHIPTLAYIVGSFFA